MVHKDTCVHYMTHAEYKNEQQLQGYRCVHCGVLKKVNPAFQKNKKAFAGLAKYPTKKTEQDYGVIVLFLVMIIMALFLTI